MRVRRWPAAAVILVALCQISCAGSLLKDARNGLAGMRAAYLIEEEARASFCAGKTPQPPVCVKGLTVAKHAYKLLKDGAELVATYAETKAQPLEQMIVGLIGDVTQVTVDLQAVIGEFR